MLEDHFVVHKITLPYLSSPEAIIFKGINTGTNLGIHVQSVGLSLKAACLSPNFYYTPLVYSLHAEAGLGILVVSSSPLFPSSG